MGRRTVHYNQNRLANTEINSYHLRGRCGDKAIYCRLYITATNFKSSEIHIVLKHLLAV